MSKVTVSFETDNAAFRDENGELDDAAVAQVLSGIASDVLDGDYRPGFDQPISDYNGNHVGWWTVTEE